MKSNITASPKAAAAAASVAQSGVAGRKSAPAQKIYAVSAATCTAMCLAALSSAPYLKAFNDEAEAVSTVHAVV